MTSLDWMSSSEDYLDDKQLDVDAEEFIHTQSDNNNQNADMGPAALHNLTPENDSEEDIKYFGYVDSGGKAALSEEDKKINDGLLNCVSDMKDKSSVSIDFPKIAAVPVNEFGDKKIFALAFPWLFPGGFGDIKDFDGNMTTWGKNLLFYEDGRFAKDKMFSFFAVNYIIRHRNSSSGNWFISDFKKDCPSTLQEIKENIIKGDTSIVNSINYYNQRVKGSSSYWQKKRQEVYSWINYHIEQGHGAPSYFITLSCAEYFWPDVLKLIRERMIIEGYSIDIAKEICNKKSKGFVKLISDYSIVVQEYFQERTKLWLDTVGKSVFNIAHYWVRYEFAPGRGQIHAHLLAIPNDQSIYKQAFDEGKKQSNQEKRQQKRAEIIGKWAETKFGLTASVDNGFDDINIDLDKSPVLMRFTDVQKQKSDVQKDKQRCLKYCQNHICSAFCLRENKKIKGCVTLLNSIHHVLHILHLTLFQQTTNM